MGATNGDDVKPRVNASMLPNHQGRTVCIIGVAHEISGSSFKLKTSDDQVIMIDVGQPIQDYIDGLVEVQGMVTETNSINCENYVIFSPEATSSFNMNLYNKAVELTQTLADHYVTGVPQQQS
ncbi:unnamed protein product [Owenia fusiformis]|uniref:Uncharacterized protein n=1 Tax=Owenia fusiformis TaxID=6347 RepID=A0A8J1TQB3_OWEFU|nr:unnamed protein product [Owenia fusiformis]